MQTVFQLMGFSSMHQTLKHLQTYQLFACDPFYSAVPSLTGKRYWQTETKLGNFDQNLDTWLQREKRKKNPNHYKIYSWSAVTLFVTLLISYNSVISSQVFLQAAESSYLVIAHIEVMPDLWLSHQPSLGFFQLPTAFWEWGDQHHTDCSTPA